eukprot:3490512-Rhodomonas_salina.1
MSGTDVAASYYQARLSSRSTLNDSKRDSTGKYATQFRWFGAKACVSRAPHLRGGRGHRVSSSPLRVMMRSRGCAKSRGARLFTQLKRHSMRLFAVARWGFAPLFSQLRRRTEVVDARGMLQQHLCDPILALLRRVALLSARFAPSALRCVARAHSETHS